MGVGFKKSTHRRSSGWAWKNVRIAACIVALFVPESSQSSWTVPDKLQPLPIKGLSTQHLQLRPYMPESVTANTSAGALLQVAHVDVVPNLPPDAGMSKELEDILIRGQFQEENKKGEEGSEEQSGATKNKKKSKKRCSYCDQFGHNKRKCPELELPAPSNSEEEDLNVTAYRLDNTPVRTPLWCSFSSLYESIVRLWPHLPIFLLLSGHVAVPLTSMAWPVCTRYYSCSF
jgi:hypothetical protein